MSCVSGAFTSSKRSRFDDEYTASTYDPVTLALGKLVRYEQGCPDPMKALLSVVVDILPENMQVNVCRYTDFQLRNYETTVWGGVFNTGVFV